MSFKGITVIPNMAHNIKPFQAPYDTWLIYYILGNKPNPGHYNCSQTRGRSKLKAMPPPPYGAHPVPHQMAGPIMIASASSPDAPRHAWKVHSPLTDSVRAPEYNAPSMFSVYGLSWQRTRAYLVGSGALTLHTRSIPFRVRTVVRTVRPSPEVAEDAHTMDGCS